MEGQAKKAREGTPVCRLIGPGSKAPVAANEAAAAVIKREKCQLIDWDGDPIGSEGEGRTFASAIRELGGFSVTLSPHCVPGDCGTKAEGNQYGPDGADAEETAEAHRAAGNQYMAPGVQMVSQEQLSQAIEKVINVQLPGALPEPPVDANFNKYFPLAIADRLATPPDVVIWQMDNNRDKKEYWNWVSLAEYQAMLYVANDGEPLPERSTTKYILINNEGRELTEVEEAGQPWQNWLHFGKPYVPPKLERRNAMTHN
jgi:hypothetical protein